MNSENERISAVLGFNATSLSPTVKSVTGANPAANAEVTFGTVPTGKVWILLSASVSLVQGATQTPLPALSITDGTNVVAAFPGCSAAVSASTTSRMTWSAGITVLTAGAALTANSAPLPARLILPAGYVVATITAGIGANTDYAAGSLLVVEYA